MIAQQSVGGEAHVHAVRGSRQELDKFSVLEQNVTSIAPGSVLAAYQTRLQHELEQWHVMLGRSTVFDRQGLLPSYVKRSTTEAKMQRSYVLEYIGNVLWQLEC